MDDSSSANKRIAKNTVALYIRMGISMIVTLYTSRVVLNVLGVEDYGIYGVVGGVVAMFSFLNATMSGATSRFLTFELGKDNKKDLRDTFGTAIIVHLLIAIAVFVLAETIGLWFLEKRLVIPDGRMMAARWVYQFSILAMMITITQVPYNASIISHERMDVYAYVELLNVILKLAIVFLLKLGSWDKLVFYAILVFSVNAIIAFIYRFYCLSKFQECKFKFVWRKDILKPMLVFSGWDLYGNMCYTFEHQGIGFLINMFHGVVFNAAASVASSVQGVVSNISANIIQAFRPQIVKNYAIGNFRRMEVLMFNGIKYSMLLFYLFSIPILFETDTILYLWLGIVPEKASLFCQILLVASLCNLINRILGISIGATGDMKRISIISGSIYLLCLPLIYLLFRVFELPSEFAYWSALITIVLVDIANMFILKKQIPQLSVKQFLRGIFESTLIAIISAMVVVPILFYMPNGIPRLIIVFVTYFLILLLSTYLFGIDREMRSTINAIAIRGFRRIISKL